MEAEVCSDRIHMLPEIPPKRSVSSIIDYLKGKSGYMNDGEMRNFDMAIGNSGAKDTC